MQFMLNVKWIFFLFFFFIMSIVRCHLMLLLHDILHNDESILFMLFLSSVNKIFSSYDIL